MAVVMAANPLQSSPMAFYPLPVMIAMACNPYLAASRVGIGVHCRECQEQGKTQGQKQWFQLHWSSLLLDRFFSKKILRLNV